MRIESQREEQKQSVREQFRIDEEDECDLVPTARTSELNKEGSILMPKESEYQQHHRLAEPLNQSIRMTSMLNTSMVNDSFVMVDTVRDTSNIGPSLKASNSRPE